MRLNVETEGLEALGKLATYVRGVAAEFAARTPGLVRSWGPKLVQWQQENIERGVSPDGTPFAPLLPSTVRKRGPDHPYGVRPLLDTTALYQTMAYDTPGPNEVSAGSPLDYSELLQKGTRRMVARPWSGLRPENLVELEADLIRFGDGILMRPKG